MAIECDMWEALSAKISYDEVASYLYVTPEYIKELIKHNRLKSADGFISKDDFANFLTNDQEVIEQRERYLSMASEAAAIGENKYAHDLLEYVFRLTPIDAGRYEIWDTLQSLVGPSGERRLGEFSGLAKTLGEMAWDATLERDYEKAADLYMRTYETWSKVEIQDEQIIALISANANLSRLERAGEVEANRTIIKEIKERAHDATKPKCDNKKESI